MQTLRRNRRFRVLVADDHSLIRRGIIQVLAQEEGFSEPAEAETCAELLERIEREEWDGVVLDIGMPGSGGLDQLREIQRRRPHLPVLILTVHSEEQFGVRAIRLGARGYLTKSSSPAELVHAVRRIVTGKRYVSAALAEALADAVQSGDGRPVHEALSDREFQVVCGIANGLAVSEIAKRLSLSVKTISTYRARALEKMNMHTNAEFTRYAIRSGLVD